MPRIVPNKTILGISNAPFIFYPLSQTYPLMSEALLPLATQKISTVTV